jgi:ribulose 1,5-bisphosphate synthetase/thiazole synthase
MSHNLQEDFTERFRVNQQELSSEPRTRFDYIVCGAGTSGCVVAARLAADPKTHVLLLEAGGTDETDLITNPNRWPMTLGNTMAPCVVIGERAAEILWAEHQL